jgi:uncharacterized protein YdhG (YjbR/CyaY superfamily)
MAHKSTTIDEYLAGVSADRHALLQQLRKTIRSIVPEAEECISYRIPAFRLRGGIVAGFCARREGCSYFPFSGSTLTTLAGDVADFQRTKSALHFDRDKPLSAKLVRKLIKTRMAEMVKTKPSTSR